MMKLIERVVPRNGRGTPASSDFAEPQTRRRLPRWFLPAVAGALIVALVVVLVVNLRTRTATDFVTQPVLRQDLVQTVTASGTVNPQDTVAVGTQDSGTVNAIYVDFNSVVKKGQVLATLDPQPFQAALDQARANLAQSIAQAQAASATAQGSLSNVTAAQAGAQAAQAQVNVVRANAAASTAAVQSANAEVSKAQGALTLAQATFNRDSALLAQGYVSQSQLDIDRSNLIAAQSALRSAVATAQQVRLQAVAAQTQLQASADTSRQQIALGAQAGQQANQTAAQRNASQAAIGIQAAQVQQAQLNLDRSIIRSPVDGTVIARNVSVGQTVAASFQTPTLFTIAKDLTKMQADVAVGENDIGNVKRGEAVDFTVLAYPTRTFHGVITQVRQSPTVTNNVVTYDSVALVENNDGALRPGMTANASIHVATAPNALVVPIEALTYRPPGMQRPSRTSKASKSGRGAGEAAGAASGTPSGPNAAGGPNAGRSAWGQTTGGAARSMSPGSRAVVFVLRNGKAEAVPVSLVLVSGAQAAVAPRRGAVLKAGDQVILSDSSSQRSTQGQSRSPLTGPGQPRFGPGGIR